MTLLRKDHSKAQVAAPIGDSIDDAVDDAVDDDMELLAAPDPLALEPLSSAEIASITADHGPDRDEQSEGAMEGLRKSTEMKLPFDPDEASFLPEATDAHLEIHQRRERRRRSKQA
jgi:hypothetical protein